MLSATAIIADMSDTETLGARIRAARKAAKLSQEELARQVGTSSGTVARYERGEIEAPGGKVLSAIATVLNVTERWLTTGEETRSDVPVTPLPAGWIELCQRRPGLVAKFTDEEQAEIRAFAARYHRARSWTDYETVLLRISEARPSAIFEEKKGRAE